MLELKKITKIYETGTFKQKALDGLSINFRKNEFASILGQSGSGKTTLLNIIGGLDSYTSGDLTINGISTKKYKDSDWDTYRNHRIGFIFQSYNLITHQSILSNVELALTLSGVSKAERRKTAKEVLNKVGLKDHINKKPNQLSGGQMQRVAIARALINNPDILLADEPTGALDSETSIQIMNLLKEIAKDKLVILVTHNPELAEKYSTRIINLKDGKITNDTNPYDGNDETWSNVKTSKNKKTSMSFFTAFGLSLNNLMTKKGRTILTAFAGSIGIIGIAVILSVSTGVRDFIDKTEEETLSSYPISIRESSLVTSFLTANRNKKTECDDNKICSNNIMGDLLSSVSTTKSSNNIIEFKNYIESGNSNIKNYVNDIKYQYGFELQIYSSNLDIPIKVNPNSLAETMTVSPNAFLSGDVFKELMNNDRLLETQYEVLAGKTPTNYDEIVLIVDENNSLSDYILYAIGLKDQKELANIKENIIRGEEYKTEELVFEYDDLLTLTYKLVLNTDYYLKENNKWVDKSTDLSYMKQVVNNGIELKIVGILKPDEEATSAENSIVGYRHDLIEYVVNNIKKTEIAKEQLANENIDVFTGKEFDNVYSSYSTNLTKLGIANLDEPTAIEIYAKSFDDKEAIQEIIKDYNEEKSKSGEDDKIITYTDYVGLIMSSVTTIIDVVTIGLIGFVGVSLVVSSIMISVITYISVLERTKEIGVLRAVGASKKDISRVFNAETFIEGLIAGVLGISITLLINILINIIVKNYANVSNIAQLTFYNAFALILISVFLTVIAGFIPAKMASKKDPVEALRSE